MSAFVDKEPDSKSFRAVRRDGRYVNRHDHADHNFGDLLRWKFGRGPEEPSLYSGVAADAPAPRVEPDLERLADPDPDRWQITWIGHATFLIQHGGRNLLTDPVFSTHCFVLPLPRLRRLVEPGLPIAKLPRIDGVLLTHSHYDHCDRPTLKHLGSVPDYFAPEGLDRLVRRWTGGNVVAASWGDELDWRGWRIRCLPAQHFSARSPFDRNRTLWCSWMIEADGCRIYFAGDSGYCPLFREVGERFDPIDLAFLPIGAYQPRWFMAPVHMSASEAVRAHMDLGARRSVAMHWGTFRLTDEPMSEPPALLQVALEKTGVGNDAFVLPSIGETLVV